MGELERLDLASELEQIVLDPIRGIRPSALRLDVTPGALAVRTCRPGALRRLLSQLIAAASWGGGLRFLHVSALWERDESAPAGWLRLAVGSRRAFQSGCARVGWNGVEQVLLGEVRRTLELVGGGELVVRSGDGELACEVRLTGLERDGCDPGGVAVPGAAALQAV